MKKRRLNNQTRIGYFSETFVNELIHKAAIAIASIQRKETAGGIFVIHEAIAKRGERLNCWNFIFGNPTEEEIIELSDDCMIIASSMLCRPHVNLSTELGYEPGGICAFASGLIFSSVGMLPPENEALTAVTAFQMQSISTDFFMGLADESNDQLIPKLVQRLKIKV